MIVRLTNSEHNKHNMAGARIHDYTSNILETRRRYSRGRCRRASGLYHDTQANHLRTSQRNGRVHSGCGKKPASSEIPIHVLIETHGALRDVEKIATLPWLQVIDFGLMDFISGHHGAIALSNMKSPGQFDHKLLARAKGNCVAAARKRCRTRTQRDTRPQELRADKSDASRARTSSAFCACGQSTQRKSTRSSKR
jgi:citrate lyase subunit beta/citryl-CoA lyase